MIWLFMYNYFSIDKFFNKYYGYLMYYLNFYLTKKYQF